MRLTTKGRFAVTAMLDLALHEADKPVTLAGISERQDISLSYLEQLFSRLRRNGLVKSVRGPGGGYRLSSASSEIMVSDIVLAVDEPIRATRCSGQGSPKGCMIGGERCITHDLWAGLGDEIHRYLSSVSLEDVVMRRTRRSAPLDAREGVAA